MHDEDMLLSDADFSDIRRLEESLWIAETRFDTRLMNEVFAKDFFEFGRSGRTYARADLIIEARPGQIIDATIPLLNFHAWHLSADIVQVTYISEAVYGNEVERANRSSIWSRDAGDGNYGFIRERRSKVTLPHSGHKNRNEELEFKPKAESRPWSE